MTNLESLLADAARLPIPDRIELIEALWDTVPESALPPLSEEWLSEIDRRSTEYERGSVVTVPWQEVRAGALRRLRSQND
jgi:putative addiction module component (TIGR02574 family)